MKRRERKRFKGAKSQGVIVLDVCINVGVCPKIISNAKAFLPGESDLAPKMLRQQNRKEMGRRKGNGYKLLSLALILLLTLLSDSKGDEVTCVTDRLEGHSLHYLCFCGIPKPRVELKPEAEDFFSLADFAYNLSGSYFAKNVFINFHSCRFVRLVLDHLELSRIGSSFFRPDIQVRGISVDHVYHIDLDKFSPPQDAAPEDYLTIPTEDLVISTKNVALVGVQRGAKFSNLVALSNETELYIDLNGSDGDEEVNIHGFSTENIYFVTNTEQEVPLNEVNKYYCELLTTRVGLYKFKESLLARDFRIPFVRTANLRN